MKIATWNVNSLRVRMPHLNDWLSANPVDVVALQETKLPDLDFPAGEMHGVGLQCVFNGQKSYNGVAIIARPVLEDVVIGIPGYTDTQCRVIAATVGGVRIIDVYVPNGQAVGSEKYAYKLLWLAALQAYVEAALLEHPRLVLLGDFNIAPEDRDVHDPQAWQGSVHVSEPERAALKGLLATGLTDCFRLFEQPEKTYSWWDYRMLAFRRNHGLRIDLILASAAMAQKCVACHIDKTPRKLERPSDHAPVIAAFDI